MYYPKADQKRYFRKQNGIWSKLKIIVLTQRIWATIRFRLSLGATTIKRLIFGLRSFYLLTILQKVVEITTGILIPLTAKIGKGLYIGHFGGIIPGPKTVIGEYCNIFQGLPLVRQVEASNS